MYLVSLRNERKKFDMLTYQCCIMKPFETLNNNLKRHDNTKHEIHTGCPSDLVLPLQQQMELAYGGVAIIVQEAEQHRTCLDKLHSVCRQQMQKSAVRKQNIKS